MAPCARYKECAAIDSLDEIINRLLRIFAGYNYVLPFSRARELDNPSAGRMEGLSKVLVSLARGDEPSMDASIKSYSGADNCMSPLVFLCSWEMFDAALLCTECASKNKVVCPSCMFCGQVLIVRSVVQFVYQCV